MPVLPAAREYVAEGIAPGGTHANRRFLSAWVNYDPDITEAEQLLLCDAQTSGGLLAALPRDRADDVVRELHLVGITSSTVIGTIEAGEPGRIRVCRAAV